MLIGVYIILRFHTWRLSLGAILAVMHDPILVLGVFSVTKTKFDLAVVAAILAVIGYSLNDTVIVFDRIRETFEKNRRQASNLTLDQAINQTLSRTIMTKVTTSIVCGGHCCCSAARRCGGILRGAAHRHHRRYLFVDLDFQRDRAVVWPTRPSTYSPPCVKIR